MLDLTVFDIRGAAAVWHALAIKGEVSRYSGTDIGAENQFFVVVGPTIQCAIWS